MAIIVVTAAVLLSITCDKKDNPVEATNNSPVANITNLAANASYLLGDTITFTATATDTEDGTLADSCLTWSSSLDGAFGTGKSCQIDTLTAGTHKIILTATDSNGAVGADTVTVIISQNSSPVVIISSPANGSAYIPGEAITFNGSAVDSGDGTLTDSSLVWTSDQDGQIGIGTTFTSNALSENSHTIILAATDSRGAVGYDTVTVVISQSDSPVVVISSPTDGSTFTVGQTITFAGSATDTEDGSLTGTSLVWTSDKDGQIGTGTSDTTSSLSANTHVIILTATDRHGAVGADTVTITRQPSSLPILVTAAVSAITSTTGQCGGNITSDGGATVTARGVCWSTNTTPTIANSKTADGSGAGSFTSSITGLTGGTIYYVRSYATNSVGTGYGDELSFTTAASTVTDIDGNVYRTVTIGSQVWMAENLKVTHYRNGDAIPYVLDNTTWAGLSTGAYANPNGDISNVDTYGRLYNWYAAIDGRNIAPVGWHVPSRAEMEVLEDYVGNYQGGGKLKEEGTVMPPFSQADFKRVLRLWL